MPKKRPKSTQTVDRKAIKEAPKVDVGKALRLRIQNKMTYDLIAKQFGVSRQAIAKSLKPFLQFLENPGQVEAYRENRAEFLDSAEIRLLQQIIDEGKLKAASVNNLAYAIGQLNNIGRLERGQSTTNVALVAGLSPEDREWLAGLVAQYTQRRLGDGGESDG